MNGKRLLFRLTARCNSGCEHCTLTDIAHLPDRGLEEACTLLAQARKRGCSELVIMRGEATILAPELVHLIQHATNLGYGLIQLQTNGRMLAYSKLVNRLLRAGLNAVELSFFGHTPELHDAIDGVPGAYHQVRAAIAELCKLSVPLMVTIPIIRKNHHHLADIVEHLHQMGVQRVQLNFSRPMSLTEAVPGGVNVTLAETAVHLVSAVRRGRQMGLEIQTEAFPLCLLPSELHDGIDSSETLGEHEVIDLHRQDLNAQGGAHPLMGHAPKCHACTLRPCCPGTWTTYITAHGDRELQSIG